MIPNPIVDMGNFLPSLPAKRRITGDTQFMFQFYKPCIHFYAPNEHIATYMSKDMLYQSLVVALHGCPLLFGRLKVHDKDKSVWLEYSPSDSNPPTLEFQTVDITYGELAQRNFAYSVARQHRIDMAIPDGTICSDAKHKDKPMLMIKVNYLADGGIAVFSMSNHVAFDGNAVFSFLAHWASCNRRIDELQTDTHKMEIPHDLQVYATSLVTNTSNGAVNARPAEISVAADKSAQEIGALINKSIPPSEGTRACVFSISTESLAQLHGKVKNSGVLGPSEWVSSNNVLAAFVGQCVARASTEAQTYATGDWTVFQTMDMRRALGLSLQGLGSPLMLAECQMTFAEISSPAELPFIAKRVRQSINKYTGEYLQNAMDWMHHTYIQLAQRGVDEPWRRFWFTALNTNSRAVGLSFMNRIPVYGADFGAGRPAMARSFNPRVNYIIVFPGPPLVIGDGGSKEIREEAAASGKDFSELHLYVTLETKAMEALLLDKSWSALCTLISKES
ncbi:hypothetical protein IW140_005552 [Coemansia sp. RSA 1813]|nr:hypothetical protein EV178_005543 [Coemansia sp. RSA 1646]KAJ1766067.1 hypothetical protein LPJ74_006058 [Coemansia sp. RSA 1843]KAJ2086787.1 hypothetical protein IW138_005411 [Coemansia sp. RSA 986]KAJ2211396.1 hypothetical protein EV179_005536 [Coemansia sp. RSA 487]KAJ2564967.1 hypothetical protein IW140_005552 [Coemansia sp. RSA 1813]